MTVPNGWQLDKTVSIGHIVTTLTIIISLFVWIERVDLRLIVLETEIVQMKGNESRLEATQKENVDELKSILLRIEQKLDDKADKK
jgi:hypothetical protein